MTKSKLIKSKNTSTPRLKPVALVTYNQFSERANADLLLKKPFEKTGFTIQMIPWNKKGICWETFNAIILRSCWDYHLKTKRFLNWLNILEKKHVCAWNPIPVIRWNIDKKYLLELQAHGIPIISTFILNNKTKNKSLEAILNHKKWPEAVMKPTIGAAGDNVFRIKIQEARLFQEKFEKILKRTSVIIQPFMKEILSEGEYSFIFFNGQYSHAVLKIPALGEFRPQVRYGGVEKRIIPKLTLIKQAKRVITVAQKILKLPLLYARVDGLKAKNKFLLSELELIEPYLFFKENNQSPQLFANAFKKLYGNKTQE